jgi:hypothetical protein
MNEPVKPQLTIQKFIFLLDEFHYELFRNHLVNTKASLPLKLSETIRAKLPGFHSPETLCTKVYGNCDQNNKLKFNQLSTHTFKLSNVLAKNYPDYLRHHISGIEKLINNGNRGAAMLLAHAVLDVAEKTEDFQSQIGALKFLMQDALMIKNIHEAVQFNTRLQIVLDWQATYAKIMSTFRQANFVMKLETNPHALVKVLEYFRQYHTHESIVIRIVSLWAYFNVVYHYKPGIYKDTHEQKIIEALEREFQNHPQVVFWFMFDLKGNFAYLKLNSYIVDIESKEWQKEYYELSDHLDSVKFWKSLPNSGQMYMQATQASRLMTKYHHLVHRDDYAKLIRKEDMELLGSIIDHSAGVIRKCDTYPDLMDDKKDYLMLHSSLLILKGGKNIAAGTDELESVLITYQQADLKAVTDSIFVTLMIGYFSSKKYQKCVQTYRRYCKVIRGKPTHGENDFNIKAYYYLSQWLLTGSKQYPEKLRALLKGKQYEESKPQIVELLKYFQLDAVEV